MNNDILVILICSISCILLFFIILSNNKTEGFKFNLSQDIILPPRNYDYTQPENIDNQLIIPKDDKFNSYPIGEYGPRIIDPTVPVRYGNADQIYVDNVFERDKGVTDAMNQVQENDNKDYMKVADAFNTFKQPINSASLLKFKMFDEFKPDELKDKTLHDIYDEMTSKVNLILSPEEVIRLTGKPIDIPTISGLYKPIYVSIDNTLDNEKLPDVEYKFKGYETIPFGSLI